MMFTITAHTLGGFFSLKSSKEFNPTNMIESQKSSKSTTLRPHSARAALCLAARGYSSQLRPRKTGHSPNHNKHVGKVRILATKSLQYIQDFDRSSEKYDSGAYYRHLRTRTAALLIHETGDSAEKRLPKILAVGTQFSRVEMVRP